MTFASRLNAKINGAARVRLYCPHMQAWDDLRMSLVQRVARAERLLARATAYARANPRPRAVFIVA